MQIRLMVHGNVDGDLWAFWKLIDDAPAIPRLGETVYLGVRSGAPSHLEESTVTRVTWSASLDSVDITLDDLHEGWLFANRRAFHEAGWATAMLG